MLNDYVDGTVDPAICEEFEKHMAELQRADAQVMKQQRMAREESEALDKKKKGNTKGGGRGGGEP